VTDEHETGAVRVSMRDIYIEVQRQGRLLEKIANSLPDSESKIDDHEARIRKLEMRYGLGCGRVRFGCGSNALDCRSAWMKPSWKIRRRYIFAAFSLGAVMLIAGSAAVLLNNDSATSDLITGGVALVTLVLTSYIFGAVWEDKKKENPDG